MLSSENGNENAGLSPSGSIRSFYELGQYLIDVSRIAKSYVQTNCLRFHSGATIRVPDLAIAVGYERRDAWESEFTTSPAVWIAGRRISGSRPGCLEREGEERGYGEKCERHDIIPRELLLQKRECEHDENDDRDDLLNNFELES